jgi:hippurate hydrolase
MAFEKFRSIMLAGAALGLAWGSAAKAADVAKEKAEIDARLDRDYPRLEALYRDIHAHPELAFQETATAARLAKEMRALGFEVT